MVKGFKGHQLHDILTDPGSADLTADVDFGALSRAAQGEGMVTTHWPLLATLSLYVGAGCAGPMTQNEFLHKMGIRQRLQVTHIWLRFQCASQPPPVVAGSTGQGQSI